MKTFRSFWKLSRIQDYYGTVVIISAIGLLVTRDVTWINILLLMAANLLNAAFIFMINDIEDSEDDSRDLIKKHRNPLSSGEIGKNKAWFASWAVALMSLALYILINWHVLIFGSLGLILGYMYSSRRIRLKAKPIVDIVSHGFFLGFVYFITAALSGDNPPRLFMIVFLGMLITLASSLSDINNEIRDLEVDKKAGLRNTAYFLDLQKYKKILSLLAVFCVFILFSFVFIYVSLYTKIILLSIAFISFYNFLKNWKSHKGNIYSYSYTQGIFYITGLLLILNP